MRWITDDRTGSPSSSLPTCQSSHTDSPANPGRRISARCSHATGRASASRRRMFSSTQPYASSCSIGELSTPGVARRTVATVRDLRLGGGGTGRTATWPRLRSRAGASLSTSTAALPLGTWNRTFEPAGVRVGRSIRGTRPFGCSRLGGSRMCVSRSVRSTLRRSRAAFAWSPTATDLVAARAPTTATAVCAAAFTITSGAT